MKSTEDLKKGEGEMTPEMEAKQQQTVLDLTTRGKAYGILTYK